ncbi:spore germination protein GerPC [Paenibacillus senegalensis]|uniref:spore germination protein GerPC n=1 Tax=Paenibacillus senegalensis TaxID=1465766 RepID=UPI0005A85488|nr:spore germination protein GerPC [Paenibacillus senegalensis]
MDPRFLQWLQEIHGMLLWQNGQIQKLEELLLRQQAELSALKDSHGTHIEKIEYNFDQLKVETLEGTLNIGLTPNGMNAIEDMVVPSSPSNEAPDPEEAQDGAPDFLYPQIQNQVRRYISNELEKDLSKLETNYNEKLDDQVKAEIVRDIQRQVDHRITVYLKQLRQGASQDEQTKTDIVKKVKRDIRLAIGQFFERHYGKDSEEDEDGSGQQGN